MSRRSLLMALVCAVGIHAAAPALAEDPDLQIHILNRLAFGPDAESLNAIRVLGVDGWIDRQLDPADIARTARA